MARSPLFHFKELSTCGSCSYRTMHGSRWVRHRLMEFFSEIIIRYHTESVS